MSYTKPEFKAQYENFIGGEWVAPVDGKYFEASSPIDNKVMCKVAQSNKKDVAVAVEAGYRAFETWGKTSVVERSTVLNAIADAMQENLEMLALAETWDNGKAIRETINADLPLAIDHFRYFAGVIRAEAGTVADLDANTVTQEVHEPLG
ncbi:MAG: aldehyde dehydrogenase family protein, partial [Campylobacterota bacterium]|nr:aldehyde dehydrogenase family protein [Campylobacterota bacterium]